MWVPITALYAGILGVLMLVLAMRVSRARMESGASLSTDATPKLVEAIRRHGNFIEWVPFALLLMLIGELDGMSPLALHAAGAALVVARVLHPLGVKVDVMPHPLRAAGATLTFVVVLLLSIGVMLEFFTH
jgi:hypothetical protein